MATRDTEDEELRSAALLNATSILLARQRAERELVAALAELKRKSEELREQREWFRVALASIGDAVITTDLEAQVTFLNPVAEKMTGWSNDEARGRPLGQVFNIIHERTRQRVENPAARVLREGITVELANHTVLLSRDGRETAIEDSAAPIRDAAGNVKGAVMVFHDVTERRRAEDALRDREERLRAVVGQAAVGIALAGLDGRFEEANQKFVDVLGYSEAELRGLTFAEITHPEDLPETQRRVKQLLARETNDYAHEKRYVRKDGGMVWSLTSVTLLKDARGEPHHFVGIVEDITQRKRAEDALREETRGLELLNKTGTAIAARLDMKSLLQTVTDAATDLSGAKFGAFFYTTKDENGGVFLLYTICGAPREAFEKFGHPRVTPLFGPTFEGAAPVRCDDVLKDPRYGKMGPHHGMPAGHLAVRSFLAVPVVSRSGEVFGGLLFGHPEPGVFTERAERIVVGVAGQAASAIDNARLYEAAQKEIVERGRTEQRLRESEARLRVSLETAALGTWELDLESNTVTLDERCQELFGLDGTPMVDRESFMALGHPDDREQRGQALRDVISGGLERYDLEYRVGAGERWIKASVKPVRDSGGAVVRVIGAVLDITDLMQARATMEERRKELERMVDERTASLQHAIAQMEEFSYSVSHDLRAPLRAIQTYAQTVIEDFGHKVGGEGMEYLQRIVNAGSRMDRLTRDVLTYSKVSRADAPLVSLSLDRVVPETIEQYAPSPFRKGAITVAHPLLAVLGHEPLLVQAVSNLLANAVKFVAAGTAPRIHFRTERLGTDVRLWVEDNGIGISPAHQARIWGMFERVHPKERFDGTGIGLAIVRKAAERMGGTVGVESDGRTGSRFWIQLQAG